MGGKQFQLIEVTLGLFTLVTATIVWWQVRQPPDGISLYELFPLFGLVAFGLMWTHFIAGALRRRWALEPSKSLYQKTSMLVVLACILAHPALLWVALWRGGFGPPPMSQYIAYGTSAVLAGALFIAMIALTIFLSYELVRWFSARSWWRYIEWLQMPAMVMIFGHGLILGGEVTVSWYGLLWWFYGVTLLLASAYSLYHDRRTSLVKRVV